MTDPEIVICSAIRVGERVWRGHRHGHCLTAMNDELSWTHTRKQIQEMVKEQGFITSNNRFVDRAEAYQLQVAAGIASASQDNYRYAELFSEDLY